jgi:hypothetical protein
MKSLLSTATAVALAAIGTSVAARPAAGQANVVLWNQNSNFGGSVNSQNYESAMQTYDDAAADDFTIPNATKWHISEIDVTGAYASGSGPASSVIVTFYPNKKGEPNGRARYSFTLNCTDNAGSFQCLLPTKGKKNKLAVALGAGTWWVSVVANCVSQTCGTWNWTENTTVTGYQAEWRNLYGGFNNECVGWAPLSTCFGGSPADLAFTLIGYSEPD